MIMDKIVFRESLKKINPNNPEKVGELHELSHQKLIRLQRKKENLVHANSQWYREKQFLDAFTVIISLRDF